MARPVQLAPGSLALVLCRLEAQKAAGPGGRAVFRAFRRANARCSGTRGWRAPAGRRGVLLVRAPRRMQVLRDAWRRPALRPPRASASGRWVSDVFPVQMNPITQSQFVPLGEVLCCAISDMNTAQIGVTQESLLEHLMKHYPGHRVWDLIIQSL
uniref:Storkhead box 1 n=1 Tax=Rhinopithecus bieti TaxID=61621 RepID=A0A2K6K192_RHIBE